MKIKFKTNQDLNQKATEKYKRLKGIFTGDDWVKNIIEKNLNVNKNVLLLAQLLAETDVKDNVFVELIDDSEEGSYSNTLLNEDLSTYEFKFYNSAKKLFIYFYTLGRKDDIVAKKVVRALSEIDDYEKNDSISNLNSEEQKAIIVEMAKKYRFFATKEKMSFYANFEKEVLGKNNIKKLLKYDEYIDILNEGNPEKNIVTKKELINLALASENAQDTLPALLAFNGLIYSRTDTDELSLLKESDIKDGKITLRDRVIDIEPDMEELIQEGIHQQIYEYGLNKQNRVVSSIYVLKQGLKELPNKPMHYQSVNSRFDKISELAQDHLGMAKLKYSEIRNSGKKYFTEKYMDQYDLTEKEAFEKTLWRFGDLKTHESFAGQNGQKVSREYRRFQALKY